MIAQADYERAFNRSFAEFYSQTFPIPATPWYHYTNGNGLYGIIKNHELWATNIRYMNDSSEVDYGYAVIQNVLRQRWDAARDSLEKRVLSYLLEKESHVNGFLNFDIEVYVCCFCEDGDLLSQWRGYGSNGAGYSVGFDPRQFQAVAGPELGCFKILYEKSDQTGLIEQILKRSFATVHELIGANPEAEPAVVKALTRQLQKEFIGCACMMKNRKYREEREWRIVKKIHRYRDLAEQIDFRIVAGRLIPYTRIKLGSNQNQEEIKSSIREVIFGPTLQRDLTQRSLEMLLNCQGFDSDIVKGSEIPYTI